jgi:hypothetical protein
MNRTEVKAQSLPDDEGTIEITLAPAGSEAFFNWFAPLSDADKQMIKPWVVKAEYRDCPYFSDEDEYFESIQ